MRVGIVGCGVSGLASAIVLARAGTNVTIFERFEQPRPIGAGLLLQPSGLSVLDILGLGEAVRAMGARVDSLDGRTLKGRPVLSLVYERWKPDSFGLGIHRAALFDILFRTATGAGATVVTGAQIVGIDDVEKPVVRDVQQRAHGPFDLLLIADGSASALRTVAAPKARAPLYPWGALWAALPAPDALWEGCLNQRYGGASIMMGVLPIGLAPHAGAQRHVAFFWSIRHDQMEAWKSGGLDAFKARVRSLWPEAGALIASIKSPDVFAPASYRDVAARPWRKGRTLLIGDAAHGTSPQLGQGANLALVDAVELGAALAARPDSIDEALTLYVKERSAHVRWFQTLSAALTPVFQSRSKTIGALRDILMAPMCELPIVRRLMLETLCGVAQPPRSVWTPPHIKE
ncbi:MAG: NAD(P)/FAD-dependent oxidoreductase [Caulobacterales bacterium]